MEPAAAAAAATCLLELALEDDDDDDFLAFPLMVLRMLWNACGGGLSLAVRFGVWREFLLLLGRVDGGGRRRRRKEIEIFYRVVRSLDEEALCRWREDTAKTRPPTNQSTTHRLPPHTIFFRRLASAPRKNNIAKTNRNEVPNEEAQAKRVGKQQQPQQ
jgi:hypothetical protein